LTDRVAILGCMASQFKSFTSSVLSEEFAGLGSRPRTLWSRFCLEATAGADRAATVQRYLWTRRERAQRKGKSR